MDVLGSAGLERLDAQHALGVTGQRYGRGGGEIESLVTQMSVRFETSEEDPWLNGVVIKCPQRLQAGSIEQVLLPAAA